MALPKIIAAFAVLLIAITCLGVFGTPFDELDHERIIGGEIASIGQFSHQISLRRRSIRWNSTINANVTVYSHSCGGSIISERWILTAAHCTQFPTTPQNIMVVVSAHHVHNDGIRYPVDSIINHPDYISAVTRNDISLLRTRRNIQFSARVQPIGITGRYTKGGMAAVVSGWGQTEDGDLPTYLKFAKVFTISNVECIERHDASQADRIFPTTLCTYKRSGLGSCFGDSGGPLVTNRTLVGLVSWGVPCARGKPDMFTRVSEYADWVAENTGVELLN